MLLGKYNSIDNAHRVASVENRSMLSVHIIHCTVSWLVQTSLYGLTSLTLNHSLGSYHQKHKTKCAPIGNSCMDLKLVVDQITSSSYKSLVAY
jgi:hypothetical protein